MRVGLLLHLPRSVERYFQLKKKKKTGRNTRETRERWMMRRRWKGLRNVVVILDMIMTKSTTLTSLSRTIQTMTARLNPTKNLAQIR